MTKTSQNTPAVEENSPNGMPPARFEFFLTAAFIPLVALVMWYLGKVQNPALSWNWNDYLMNLLYSVFFVLAMRQAMETALKTASWRWSVTSKIISTGVVTYLLLQSLVAFFIEGISDLGTIAMVFGVGLVMVATYIVLKLFLLRLKPSVASKPQMLKAQFKGKTTFIGFDQVECLYTENKVAYAYVPERILLLNQTLTELEQELPGETFFRINRQCIINRAAIRHFERQANNTLELHLKSYDQVLSVSRAKTPPFIAWARKEA